MPSQFPVDTNEVVTSKKHKRWKYLEPILGENSEKDEIQDDHLTGANCFKALKPIKVISSKAKGPYVYKTIIGWCAVGPMGVNKASSKEMSYNIIYKK